MLIELTESTTGRKLLVNPRYVRSVQAHSELRIEGGIMVSKPDGSTDVSMADGTHNVAESVEQIRTMATPKKKDSKP